MDTGTYDQALTALSTLISQQKRTKGESWENAFAAMHVFLERLHLQDDIKKLKVIHVAGTKGKGSTCCMVESILRSSKYKTGLFTSPHLFDVRERIRINGQPVGKDIFLKHFWECYTTFKQTSTEEAGMPAFFRFLTLLSFKVFIDEGVDVAILEVGLGGRLDATNIVPQPVVCGVTSLGFDHMELLGNTLREIATEKAGIFKLGSPALTIPQEPEAQQALEKRAAEKDIQLTVVPALEHYFKDPAVRPSIGLAGSHQEINAALAVALCGTFEASSSAPKAKQRADIVGRGSLPQQYVQGLQTALWPGRCQVIQEGGSRSDGLPHLAFYLDGAHTQESMSACGHWFADSLLAESAPRAESLSRVQLPDQQSRARPEDSSNQSTSLNSVAARQGIEQTAAKMSSLQAGRTENIMIFNCMEEREPGTLLRSLVQVLTKRGIAIQHALFVPPDSKYTKVTKGKSEDHLDLSWQFAIRSKWEALTRMGSASTSVEFKPPNLPPTHFAEQDSRRGAVLPNLKSTLSWVRSSRQQNQGVAIRVLVTGSLYLVGDVLQQLGQDV